MSKRRRINYHDCVFDKCFRSDKLIVASIVNNVYYSVRKLQLYHYNIKLETINISIYSKLWLKYKLLAKYLVFLAMDSDPHEKFPVSSRSALYFLLPPRTRMVWILCWPNLVIEAGRPSSNFRLFRIRARFPPVALRLCK